MAFSLPDDLWRGRVVRCLQLPDVISLRTTSHAIGTSIVTAALLVERIDGSLARHSLTGLIDIDRTAPLPFTYVLRAAYVLEQGSSEWPGMGGFIRLAAIYRLTPANGLPLPDAYSGAYRIGSMGLFRVVPLDELPDGHRYADGYKRTDPVIRCGRGLLLYRSFSAFLLERLLCRWRRQGRVGRRKVLRRQGGLLMTHTIPEDLGRWSDGEGVGRRRVLWAPIDRHDPRYGRLLTEGITEDLDIAVDYRSDRAI
ncbi:unnamed protein product [Vitrella brassicaformis CCMP3155]|uniref:Uncharacterized protein n=1 Tax=Vitrella brassicaformis (strain CCMP3155) TaxID=1169540 RepID=A0A0G4EZE9_VITBC|nr:unnamed protein product [Vitrella brassicaformis CCMP3155]|eukprot:CEM04378.1 unnamed protein product [Vitrella brassicaformis CCMP3155]